MHVLVSAYACHPVEGSEPGVGWHILLGALSGADRVTLLTRANNVAEIREALSSVHRAKCTILGHDLHPVLLRLKKCLPGGTQAYYWAWQVAARRLVRQLHSRTPFDVSHHATFAVDWAPTATSSLPAEVAKVWGPVGGATLCPRPLLRELGPRGLGVEALRVLLGAIGRATNGKTNARRSALVIAQNNDDARAFRGIASNLLVEPNAFLDPATLPLRDAVNVDQHLIVGVGRLIPLKGWSIALRMLSRLPEYFRLHIYGSGPELERLQGLARRLGVDGRVAFMGHRARAETLQAVSRARCVVFTSLHDSAPGAVAEAIAIGTPVVGLGIGGTRQILNASRRGSIVSPRAPDIAGALAAAVLEISSQPPSPRWNSTRVPRLVAEWYRIALGGGEWHGND
ncbi:glycosyltransferase [Propioniciclava tarda]|nr:Glycosyltransferase involved in cell wall bisynthesis [Propioniciclava tarda]